MTGDGLGAGCNVTVKVTRLDGSVVKGDGSFTPGSDVVTTDATGHLNYDYILDGIAGSYTVDALGESDVILASTEFLDSPAVGFAGIGLTDQITLFGITNSSIPPDTMGAVGPSHFVESINSSFAIYTKTGTLVSHVSANVFFDPDGAGSRPFNGTFDPRILYDQTSGHWFATTMERGQTLEKDNDIILAVSRTDNPTGTWDLYTLAVGETTNPGVVSFFTDYSTLGVDSNGVYFGMRIFHDDLDDGTTNSSFAKIVATPLAPLIAASPSLGTVFQFSNITDMFSSPQPAHNFDAISGSDPAFFVSANHQVLANLNYRTLTWSGGIPTLSAMTVLNTAAFQDPRAINSGGAPASDSTTPVNTGDMRAQMAVIRDGHLWTARQVGVNSTGGNTSADRVGVEWFELNAACTTTLSVVQTKRIFDAAASDPRFYYYPSLAVSGQGHMRIGFSGSKSDEFVGAYSSSRLASDPLNTNTAPALFKAGQLAYTLLDDAMPPANRWGDYSYTSVDPSDDMTLWTIQEFASNDTPSDSRWGTFIQSFDAPAPTLNNPNASANQGQTVTVNLTGAGFFDPGPGFPNHLNVQLTGGAVNGISNVVTTFNSATSATVTFDMAANASVGSRDIVLPNPDGQTVTVTGGFTVIADTGGIVLSATGNDDTMTITMSGPAAGTYQLNSNAAVSFSACTSFTFNGNAGNDTLILDETAATLGAACPITYHGGTNTGTPGDKLTLQGGSLSSLAYNATGAGAGNFSINAAGTLRFDGLEPVTVTSAVGTMTVHVNDGLSHTSTFTSASAGNTTVSFDAGLESMTFANPTSQLTVNADAGSDTFTFTSFGSGFNAALTVNGSTGTVDTVNINTALNLGSASSTGAISITVENINLNNATISTNANGTTAGSVTLSGSVALGANVVINSDSTTASDGNVNVADTVNADNASTQNRTLVVTAGTGTMTFGCHVGGSQALADLDVTATTINLAGATVQVDDNDAAAQTVTFTGAVVLQNSVAVDTDKTSGTDNSVTFTSTINADNNTTANRTLTATAGGGTIGFQGNVGSGSALDRLVVTSALVVNMSANVSTAASSTGSSIAAPVDLQGATRTFTVGDGTASPDFAISGVISNGGLTKAGTGTLTLSATNTYAGVTSINAGTLSVGTIGNGGVEGNLGKAAIAAGNLVLGGGTLQYTGSTASTNRAFTLTAATTSSINISTAATNLTISGASAATSGGLTKIGAGTLTLSGTNQHTGVTTISAGVLSVSSLANGGLNSNIGASSNLATNLVLNGGTLKYTGAAVNTDRLFSVGTSGGTIDASGSGPLNLTNTGSIGFNSQTGTRTLTLTGTNTGSNTLSALLGDNSGASSLVKQGTGIGVLTATNTYTGTTTISLGTLAYGINNALSTGAVTVNGSTAVLALSTFTDSVGTVTVANGGSITGTTGVLTSTGTFEMQSGSASAILAGAVALNKTTSGTTVVLSGLNTYTGSTPVSAGILRANNNTVVASTNGPFGNNASGLNLAGGTIQSNVAAFSRPITVTGTNSGLDAYGSARIISSAITLNTAGTFNLNVGGTTVFSAAGQQLTLSGVISNSAGTLGLTIIGTSTVILSGANTYTGVTTISAGTLKLGAMGDATNTPLGATAAGTRVTSGAVLDLNSFTLGTAEALTLNGTGVSSGGALTNSSATAATYSGLITLGSASSIVASSGNIILSHTGPITGSGFGLTLGGTSSGSSLASIIGTVAGTVTKSGTGRWTLSGSSTYSGLPRN